MAACVLFAAWAGGAHAAEEALNPLAGIDRSALDGFLNRPLFTPSRRPVAQVQSVDPLPDAAPVIEDRPNLRLLGVIQARDDRMALVVDLSNDKRIALRKGDRIGDWRVTDVARYSIDFERDGKSVSLRRE